MSNDLGIDTWICSWWGGNSWEDVTLRSTVLPVLMPSVETDPPFTFCILYESAGILGLDPEKGIEFDAPTTEKFVNDVIFIADRYFSHPAYRKIEGKPVVYLYLSRTFSGEYGDAIRRAREAVRQLGYSLYLVGDEVYWGDPDRERMATLDAVTAYNMHGPEVYADLDDYSGFLVDCDAIYKKYRSAAAELGVGFIPGFMPGFDATRTPNGAAYYVIPRKLSVESERTFLEAMEEMALRHIDPALKTLALTSFNEWHEGTQVESSKGDGSD